MLRADGSRGRGGFHALLGTVSNNRTARTYRDEVLGNANTAVAIEAASPMGWDRWIGVPTAA